MRVKIGSTLFIGGDSKFQLAPPVEGLDTPEIRIGDGVYAGRDGGYVSGHFYGNRTIVLNGFYIGDDCEQSTQLRQDLFRLLRIRYRLPILVTDFNGKVFYTEGYVEDIKSNINNPVAGEFQLSLICPDPFFYEAQGENPKWYEYDLTLGETVSIPNEGTVEALPIITIQGGLTNPTITNETTLESMSLEVETEATDTLTINMEKRLIFLNDEAINETRTLDSSWWNLIQGANAITLDAESSTEHVVGVDVYSYHTQSGMLLHDFNFDENNFEDNILTWASDKGVNFTSPPQFIGFSYYNGQCWIWVQPQVGNTAVGTYYLPADEQTLLADAELLGIGTDIYDFLETYDPMQTYNDNTIALGATLVTESDIVAKIKLKKGYAGI